MKKFLTSFLILLFSFAICFSSIGNSYAQQDSYYTDTLPYIYITKKDAKVYKEGISTSKYLGTIKKNQTVYIKAFERNKTGSWWCKISSVQNSKNFKNGWIYSGCINFPYNEVLGIVYRVSGDYSTIPVYQWATSKSKKIGNIHGFARIEFDDFKDGWGRIYNTSDHQRDFKGKWVAMNKIDFCGFYRANQVATIRSGPSLSAKPVGVTKVNKVYPVKRIERNGAGNWWCKLDTIKIYPNERYSSGYDGRWIYLPNLTAY